MLQEYVNAGMVALTAFASFREQAAASGTALSAPWRFRLGAFVLPVRWRAALAPAGDDLYGTYEIARHTAATVPRARFVGLPQGGHVWAGHHRDIMDEIARFLNEAPE